MARSLLLITTFFQECRISYFFQASCFRKMNFFRQAIHEGHVSQSSILVNERADMCRQLQNKGLRRLALKSPKT